MMSNQKIIRLTAACGLILAGSGAGCLSMQSQTSIDAVSTTGATQPYVEAYVEYAGPQAKWAGPATFILHVSAKDAGDAQINTAPALLTAEPSAVTPSAAPVTTSPTVSVRAPAASALSQTAQTATEQTAHSSSHVTSIAAREQLARLAIALQGTQTPFHGCMSPVRVRLVRADGGIFERQGCRSELGWSRAVSDAVSWFIENSQHGSVPPALVPHTTPAQTSASAG